MSDEHPIHDLVFRFVAFRQHSFCFYREFHSEYLELQQFTAPFPPTLQQARVGQLQIDQLGRDVSDQLRIHCRAITTSRNLSVCCPSATCPTRACSCASGILISCPSTPDCACQCLQIMEQLNFQSYSAMQHGGLPQITTAIAKTSFGLLLGARPLG